MNTRLLRLKQVIDRTGLSRSTLYDLLKKGRFPEQVLISERCVGWSEEQVQQWIADRVSAHGVQKK